MTEIKHDMGIFGFGKEEDWKGFLAIGIIVLILITAYIVQGYQRPLEEGRMKSIGNWIYNNMILVFLLTALTGVGIWIIIAHCTHSWPFKQEMKEIILYYGKGADDKDWTVAIKKSDIPSGDKVGEIHLLVVDKCDSIEESIPSKLAMRDPANPKVITECITQKQYDGIVKKDFPEGVAHYPEVTGLRALLATAAAAKQGN